MAVKDQEPTLLSGEPAGLSGEPAGETARPDSAAAADGGPAASPVYRDEPLADLAAARGRWEGAARKSEAQVPFWKRDFRTW